MYCTCVSHCFTLFLIESLKVYVGSSKFYGWVSALTVSPLSAVAAVVVNATGASSRITSPPSPSVPWGSPPGAEALGLGCWHVRSPAPVIVAWGCRGGRLATRVDFYCSGVDRTLLMRCGLRCPVARWLVSPVKTAPHHLSVSPCISYLFAGHRLFFPRR